MQSLTVGAASGVDQSDESKTFEEVMEALERYTNVTGEPPLMLSGWEAEHPALTPPADLLRHLGKPSPQLRRYTYAHDLSLPREVAAEVFSDGLQFAGSHLTARHVSIQQNSTQALLLTLAALKERGVRRVIIAAPAYYALETICRGLSLALVIVPAADFVTGALDIARMQSVARLPGSVVLVTNPAYSLGVEYSPATIHQLASALPSDSWLLLDETRLGLSWRYDAPGYLADLLPRTVVVRSPSKVFFIHGRKTSLLFGDPRLLCEVEQVGEALVGSVAGDAEAVALAYLESWRVWRDETRLGISGPMSHWHRRVIACFERNRSAAQAALLPKGFTLSPIDSGPYVLAAAPCERLPSLKDLVAAQQQGVMLMSSRYFFHEHPDWLGFRINLGGDSQQLSKAFAQLQALWRQGRQGM
ncbi:MAG TPA: aminotransferase class I/II-fold pyridoxal phosphate-dependent enzyme [Ktedonobacterales bacterium]|nr:aminotransferase class I/II-fold pyridoxal phosphate-dependent enzyme [Ktedonobacterales bacterium]